jgi:hypothetical protein
VSEGDEGGEVGYLLSGEQRCLRWGDPRRRSRWRGAASGSRARRGFCSQSWRRSSFFRFRWRSIRFPSGIIPPCAWRTTPNLPQVSSLRLLPSRFLSVCPNLAANWRQFGTSAVKIFQFFRRVLLRTSFLRNVLNFRVEFCCFRWNQNRLPH